LVRICGNFRKAQWLMLKAIPKGAPHIGKTCWRACERRECPRGRSATVAVAEAEIEKALFEPGRIGLYI
jgi:hypothetical protein